MLTISMDSSEVALLARAWRDAPELVQEELRKFVAGATAHLKFEVQDRTPTTHGQLRASIAGDVRPLPGLGVEGVVGTSLSYALPVELGTKPHMPPVEPLIAWARQQLGVSGKDAERAGWAVARKIARFGTEGHFMFQGAFDANERQIVAGFSETVSRIVARLEGAAG